MRTLNTSRWLFPASSLLLLVIISTSETVEARGRSTSTSTTAAIYCRSSFPASPDRLGRLSDKQKENLLKLLEDLESIRADSSVTDEQKQQLVDDILDLAEGTTRPSDESVEQLVEDLVAALEDHELTTQEKVVLAFALQETMESAGIEHEEIEALLESIQIVLTAANIDEADVALILGDLQAIVSEFQNQHGGV